MIDLDQLLQGRYLRKFSDAITRGYTNTSTSETWIKTHDCLLSLFHDVPNGLNQPLSDSWLKMRRKVNVIRRHVPDLHGLERH